MHTTLLYCASKENGEHELNKEWMKKINGAYYLFYDDK